MHSIVNRQIIIYMIKNIFFLLCGVSVFIASCSDNQNTSDSDNSIVYPYTLELEQTMSFPIDENTSYESNNLITHVEEGIEYLVVENKFSNSLQFYSIISGALAKELFLEKEGPNGINEIHGFTIICSDSIVIYDKYKASALLINSEGEVIDRLKLKEGEDNYINHASMTRLPNIFFNGKLHMYIFPRIKLNDKAFFNEQNKFEWEYDVDSKTSKFSNTTWPDLYKGKFWGFYHTFPSRIKGSGDFLVYSYGIDKNLHTVSSDGEHNQFEAKSDYINEDIQPLALNGNMNEYFMENGIYGMIMYDQYREVYYRVAGLKTSYFGASNKPKSDFDKPYSIIILDKNFKKMGEKILRPVHNYLVKDWFICKEGLCISSSNQFNKEINEDLMQFNLLKLKKNN